jgi:N-acylglucosamine 2-epimerase
VELREQYAKALFDDVIPWWMEHSLDREYGGYFSHLERDGKPYSTDKYMWPSGRQVWMLSHLANTCQPRREWMEAAKLGADFLLAHAFRPDGKMHFRLTRQGQSRSEVLSTYTEVFAAIALAEYSRASGDDALWDRAMRLYEFLMPRLGRPDDTPMLGYPLHAQFHLNAHDMCRITVAWVFNEIRPNQRFEDDLTLSVDSILSRHWKPQLGVMLENAAMDGSPILDIVEGRMFHPGHAIECAWMLMEIAERRRDQQLMGTAIDIVLASLEHGWDQQYGGIRYLTNIDWTPVHDLGADLKLWWVHNEAQYALLLGWLATGRRDLAEWYERVHAYAFDRFPDPEYGEWFGYLNRDGSPVWRAKANGWKGCFHLPRALHRCWRRLEAMTRG